jgi:transcriptional regulator with XRE-family HTH domain
MSPFARVMRDIRLQRGIRQGDLAELINYEQTYISSLEVGIKGPPTEEFVGRLIKALSLTQVEQAELLAAAQASERKLVLDNNMPETMFWLVNELRNNLATLHPSQIHMIREIISMRERLAEPPKAELVRIRRRSSKEENM